MRQPKILTTVRTYTLSQFSADVLAGVTVAMVALPLSLAIAIASGANPVDGMITAIVGGFFISLVGGSRVQIGGPTGAFIVVVFTAIAEHGYDGLVLATFMAGVILMIAGYLRLGRLIQHVPSAVVDGFTIGIAIIIATSQLKDLFGLSFAAQPNGFIPTLKALWSAVDSFNISALAVGAVTFTLIVSFRRMAPKLPGLIFAVALGSALVFWFDLHIDTIASRFGELPNTLPMPHLPTFTSDRVIELLPTSFVIAFLAGVESLLSAMVADRMTGGKHRPNAEVLAQGVANIASSLFAGLPATGAIARTATNIRAGGQTPVAGIVHALVILVVLLVAAPVAGYLALPALAALLIITAWNMSEPHKWPSYLSLPRFDRLMLVITCVLTVLVDLTVAIGVGVALGTAMKLHQKNTMREDWTTPKR